MNDMRVQLRTMLTIPKLMLDRLGWQAGEDWVVLDVVDGRVIISRAEPPDQGDDADLMTRLIGLEDKLERTLTETTGIREDVIKRLNQP